MIPHRKSVQALLTRRGRRQQGKLLVEGVRLIEEALASGAVVERVYFVPCEAGSRAERLLASAADRGTPTWEVSDEELRSISETETPQGVVAVVETPQWTDNQLWTERTGDVVILDQVRDPGNVGTLLRTAEAAGARCVLATRGTVEFTNPKVVRSAMGSFFRLPTGYVASVEDALERRAAAGLPLVVAAGSGDDVARVLPQHGDVVLVLGGEAEGAEAEWLQRADAVVRIPQSGTVESLNVAAAGAILLFRRIWSAAGP